MELRQQPMTPVTGAEPNACVIIPGSNASMDATRNASMDATGNASANASCQDGMGTLPPCAPLANPYVPFQQQGSNKYEPGRGLIRGTMFPGLDLPFMGMVNNQEKPATLLHKIQAIGFAIHELGLYLDTHVDDSEALELQNSYRELYGELMAEYESKHGPMNLMQAGTSGQFDWVDDPWPWDYDAQREG